MMVRHKRRDPGTRTQKQVSEMRFLRAVLGVSRRDQLRNDDIKNALLIYNKNDRAKQYRQCWTGYVQRVHQDRLPKQLMFYLPRGNRNIGRQKKR